MQKVLVSFYHCPMTASALEQDLGSLEYSEINREHQRGIILNSLFSNYFNLYLKVGVEISKKDAEKYFDNISGKLYGFITESDNENVRIAGIIFREYYLQLDERYREQNIQKIIS